MLGGGAFLGASSAFFLEASGSANMIELSNPLLGAALGLESTSLLVVVLLFVARVSPTVTEGVETGSEIKVGTGVAVLLVVDAEGIISSKIDDEDVGAASFATFLGIFFVFVSTEDVEVDGVETEESLVTEVGCNFGLAAGFSICVSPKIEVATEPLSDKMLSKMELDCLLPGDVVETEAESDPDLLDVDGDNGVSAFGAAEDDVDLDDLGV